jgi:hypothetical protein
MGDIKRQINSITDLKRASTNVNFVYRGAILVWQRSTVNPTLWLTNGISSVFAQNTSTNWITSGINIKLQ